MVSVQKLRLKMMTNLENFRILTEPKNAIVKQYKKLFSLEGVELEFEDDALKEIAQKAIKRKTGARGLRSIVEDLLLETMFEIPSDEDIEKVIITKDNIINKTKPTIIINKEKNKNNK